MSKAPRYSGRATTTGAMHFLLAFQQSCPKGLGDRDYIGTLNEMLSTAIRCGMPFSKGDHAHARELDISTSVGVFRLVDEIHYSSSCREDSTYARMYEGATGLKPWKATLCYQSRAKPRGNGRVAPGIGVLLPPGKIAPKGEPDVSLQFYRHEDRDYELWWCTSMKNEVIRLGRYKHERYRPEQSGTPVKRVELSRSEWEKLAFELTPAQPNAEAPA